MNAILGMSSLMVRSAARLREEGVGVAVLDLTAIGINLTAEQWYGGLLTQTAQQLGLEDELEAFWDGRRDLGPLHRWMLWADDFALEIVGPEVPSTGRAGYGDRNRDVFMRLNEAERRIKEQQVISQAYTLPLKPFNMNFEGAK